MTAVQDASGARSISYGRYGSQLEEVQQIASSRFLLQEQRDAYGRGTGYILKRNGNRQCAATVAYGTLGRIALAGFIHAGVEHQFRYGYLAGSNLLQSLAMPNGVTLTQSYEEKRDLLTGMDYVRDNSLITQRQYNYDALGRPMTRDTRYPNKAIHHNDTFAYNKRSELTGALLDENAYTYAYDNIGNREIAQEVAEGITYAANDLNQYTRISTNGENFTPEYDADGNQTLIQTSTGIWKVQYNAQNRAIKFESEDGRTVITCGYDYMGRRFEKKVITNGTTTLNERYIYRGYLQIAAYDLREGHAEHPDLRFIIWDPTQEIATRPLAIRENGVWYTYGWNLTKNICELYGQEGFIRTIYTYSPYGQVIAEGDVIQPIRWGSEYHDAETGLVYYNYRYYNPLDGRWTRRDPRKSRIGAITNLYRYTSGTPVLSLDILGLISIRQNQPIVSLSTQGYIPEESENTECGQLKNQALKNPKVTGFIQRNFEGSDCPMPTIICACCKGDREGAAGWNVPVGKGVTEPYIVLCTGKQKEQTTPGYLVHELTHRLQNCRSKSEFTCEKQVHDEMEAYRNQGLSCESAWKGSLASVHLMPECKDYQPAPGVESAVKSLCNIYPQF